jgi:hypothetical protein
LIEKLKLWFEVNDFNAACPRRGAEADIFLSPHRNPPNGSGGPNHWVLVA